MKHPFADSLREIKRRARENIEQGAVTSTYQGDRETVIRLLNEALATEIVCTLRYKQNYIVADGLQAGPVADEFLQHANEEQGHADQIALRIRQLGGTPHLNPAELLALSHAEYRESEDLVEMIRENLIAERIAIDSYREMIAFLTFDPTTRRMMEGILAMEEEHAEDLASLLALHQRPSAQQMSA